MLESGAWGNNLVEIGSVRAYDVDRLDCWKSFGSNRLMMRPKAICWPSGEKDRLDVEPAAGDLTRV
jgi:hypothetical protein